MKLTVFLSFLGTSVVFGLIPGPSVCFTLAHTLNHGIRLTLTTIAGQLSANCLQIVIVLMGLSGVLSRSPLFFSALKTAGALYLLSMGIKQWLDVPPLFDCKASIGSKSGRRAFLDGFLACGTNPKAIFYYAALLPQFIIPSGNKALQICILALSSIAIAGLVLTFYTLLSGSIRKWFENRRFLTIQARLSGILMIGAGILLTLSPLE